MPRYIIANWKANKTEKETIEWFREMTTFDFSKVKDIEIIACLPYIFLPVAKEEIKRNLLPIKLGAQNISRFKEGPYTGIVTGKMIKDFAAYVLIGHSERRKLLKETDEVIVQKTILAIESNLVPIICFSNLKQAKAWVSGLKEREKIENCLFLYEPIEAIGSGKAESKEEAEKMTSEIKKIVGAPPVLYGGSVNANNVANYFSAENIDGVAIGGASLDPRSFLNILENVAKI